MKTELYINHKKVDLSPDTQITLNFNSNIFGDITKIRQSWTQTVHLPKTLKNRQTLDVPDIVSYGSSILRKYSHTRLLRNGIELFTGRAVLLVVTETLEMGLFWGETAALLNLVRNEEETTINDYLDDDTTTEWGSGILSPFQGNYGKYRYSNGVPAGERQSLPSIQAFHILEKIAQRSGLNFVFADKMQNFLKTLYIPCNSINYLTKGKTYEAQGNAASAIGSSFSWIPAWSVVKKSTYDYNGKTVNTVIFSGIKRIIFNYKKENINISVYRINDSNVELLGDLTQTATTTFNTNGETFEIFLTGIHTDQTTYKGTIYLKVEEDTGTEITLPYPAAQYPVYYNLPKITLLNFIKGVCHITGLYATRRPSDTPETVRFISIADVYANRVNALDWSDCLRHTDVILHTYLQAQSNSLKYAADETVNVKADGIITEQNETLPRKADLFTLPFAPTGNRTDSRSNPLAYLPQWTKETDGTYTFNELKPRILRLVATFTPELLDAYLTFEGLKFADLIPQFYKEYQTMVEKPVVVECTLKLNELDLKNLDFSIPVYFRQLGRFYAIITIQNTGATCKVKMIQM